MANSPQPQRPDPGNSSGRPSAGDRLVVRNALGSDAPRLAVVNVEAWRSAYDGIVPRAYLDSLNVPAAEERWRERLADESAATADRTCWVAEVGGEVAAYAIVGEYRTQHDADPEERTPGWGELFAIYAHPDMRGKGAGTAVLDAALHDLTERRFTTAALWVLRHNRASIAWYGRRGWGPDGATSTWLGAGEPLEEIRLVRPLSSPLV